MKEQVRLDEKALKAIFITVREDGVELRRNIPEGEAIVAVYRLVYPQWDEIEKVGDDTMAWPTCNSKTWKAICAYFMELTSIRNRDRAFDKQVFAGGVWLNNGFSQDESLRDWWVKVAPVTVKVKELV